MKNFFTLVTLMLLLNHVCYSQTGLVGTVVNIETGIPVKGVDVSIIGGPSSTSTSSGEFRIKIYTLRAGDRVTLNLNKDGWEPASRKPIEITLSTNYIQHPVRLEMRPIAHRIVPRSKPKAKPITPPTNTPPIAKDNHSQDKPNTAGNTPPSNFPQDNTSPNRLIDTKLGSINGYHVSNIEIQKGQHITISASGSIVVGPSVGASGPEGRTSGLFGFPINQYNIIQTCNHAALIYKIGEDGVWTCCGGNCEFIAPNSGHLILNVNDNDQGNNSGSYQLKIRVFE